jgi:hypothetical protein
MMISKLMQAEPGLAQGRAGSSTKNDLMFCYVHKCSGPLIQAGKCQPDCQPIPEQNKKIADLQSLLKLPNLNNLNSIGTILVLKGKQI